MPNKLLCFANGRPGEWEAICLDYDIAVQGRSFEEVEKLLEIAIDDYVESAKREPPDIRDKLLRRSVPMGVWLAYNFGFLWHNLRRGRKRDSDRLEHSFQMSCPA